MTFIVIIPAAQWAGQSLWLTWMGVAVLSGVTIALFQKRRKLRASFFLPLICIAVLVAIRFRIEGGLDSIAFNLAGGAFILLCIVGLLVDAFWSPYDDDLAEMEYIADRRDRGFTSLD